MLMTEAARVLGVKVDEVAPLSTGVIGVKLPTERMLPKVADLARSLAVDPGVFARCIMTTDTFPKIVSRKIGKGNGPWHGQGGRHDRPGHGHDPGRGPHRRGN